MDSQNPTGINQTKPIVCEACGESFIRIETAKAFFLPWLGRVMFVCEKCHYGIRTLERDWFPKHMRGYKTIQREKVPYVIDLLTASGPCISKSEARRLIIQQGVEINDESIDLATEPTTEDYSILKIKVGLKTVEVLLLEKKK